MITKDSKKEIIKLMIHILANGKDVPRLFKRNKQRTVSYSLGSKRIRLGKWNLAFSNERNYIELVGPAKYLKGAKNQRPDVFGPGKINWISLKETNFAWDIISWFYPNFRKGE